MTSLAPISAATRSSRPKMAGIVVGVLALHLGMGWVLMQIKPIVLPPPKPKPIQVKMVQLAPPPPPVATAQPKTPEPAKPIEPPKPAQIVEPPRPQPAQPKPVPVIAAKPMPSVAPTPVTPVAVAAPAPIDVDPPPAVTFTPPAPTKTVVADPSPVVSTAPKKVSIDNARWKNLVKPEYPEDINEQLEAGKYLTVILIEIDVDGKVLSAKIHKSSGSRVVDRINQRAALRSTAYPSQENGVAVKSVALAPYEYELKREE